MLKLSQIRSFAADKREQGQRAIAKFSDALAINPAYAFEWADSAMRAAAAIEVAATLEQLIETMDKESTEEERIVKACIEYATQRALHGAEAVEHSTSACSNITKTYITSVWAELAKKAFDHARYSK